MPTYQATQQLPTYKPPPQTQPQQPLPQPTAQPPGTPQTAQRSAVVPPPSPKDIESELLRHHMQVLSTYVDRSDTAWSSSNMLKTILNALLHHLPMYGLGVRFLSGALYMQH